MENSSKKGDSGKIVIGEEESLRIRKRMNVLKITQEQLAENAGLSSRYFRDILSLDKEVNVTKDTFDRVLEELGVGINDIFTTIPDIYNEDSLLVNEVDKLIKLSERSLKKHRNYMEKIEDLLINTRQFIHTTILDEISAKNNFARDFLKKRVSFSIIPKKGIWHRFQTHPESIKNKYVCFTISPKKDNSTFYISYTLGDIEEKKMFNVKIPKCIRITYAEVRNYGEHTSVNQYFNDPNEYMIKTRPNNDIDVYTWIDQSEHYFIVNSKSDFDLTFDDKKTYTRNDVLKNFEGIDSVIFPRHSLFHREKKELPDNIVFFWRNDKFLNFNPEIKKQLQL